MKNWILISSRLSIIVSFILICSVLPAQAGDSRNKLARYSTAREAVSHLSRNARIRVHLTGSRVIAGIFERSSSDSLYVLEGYSHYALATDEVIALYVSRNDIVKGALIGAFVGAATGAILRMSSIMGDKKEDNALKDVALFTLTLSGVGCLVGGIAGSIHQGWTILYCSDGYSPQPINNDFTCASISEDGRYSDNQYGHPLNIRIIPFYAGNDGTVGLSITAGF